VSRYQKSKTNLDFTGARDSEWQWHQLGHMQVCTSPRSRQITMPAPHHSVFLQDGCPSCHPTNSVKALKAKGVLPTKWWQKPAGIDMNPNYVTVTLVYKANKNSCVSSLAYCTDSPQKKSGKELTTE